MSFAYHRAASERAVTCFSGGRPFALRCWLTSSITCCSQAAFVAAGSRAGAAGPACRGRVGLGGKAAADAVPAGAVVARWGR